MFNFSNLPTQKFERIETEGSVILIPEENTPEAKEGIFYKAWKKGFTIEDLKLSIQDRDWAKRVFGSDLLLQEMDVLSYAADFKDSMVEKGYAPRLLSFGLDVRKNKRGEATLSLYLRLKGLPAAESLHYAKSHLSLPEKIDALIKSNEALEYIHQRQYLHNDVKPGNILVKKNDNGETQVMFIDFALSFITSKKYVGVQTEEDKELQSVFGNFIYGTPGFAAPGWVRSKQTDIYSFVQTIKDVIGKEQINNFPRLADLVRIVDNFQSQGDFVARADEMPSLEMFKQILREAQSRSEVRNVKTDKEYLRMEDLLAVQPTFKKILGTLRKDFRKRQVYRSLVILRGLENPKKWPFPTGEVRQYAIRLSQMTLRELKGEALKYKNEGGLMDVDEMVAAILRYADNIGHFMAHTSPLALDESDLEEMSQEDSGVKERYHQAVLKGQMAAAFLREFFYRWDNKPKPRSHKLFRSEVRRRERLNARMSASEWLRTNLNRRTKRAATTFTSRTLPARFWELDKMIGKLEANKWREKMLDGLLGVKPALAEQSNAVIPEDAREVMKHFGIKPTSLRGTLVDYRRGQISKDIEDYQAAMLLAAAGMKVILFSDTRPEQVKHLREELGKYSIEHYGIDSKRLTVETVPEHIFSMLSSAVKRQKEHFGLIAPAEIFSSANSIRGLTVVKGSADSEIHNVTALRLARQIAELGPNDMDSEIHDGRDFAGDWESDLAAYQKIRSEIRKAA
ncbi:MAG: protein kinase [Candidatus Omnitrophica bacterium]|nr:protein kinase [Candidatus Omnitrophota bacterium]